MYYLAIVQNDETQALYRYNTYEEALAAYHTELAYRAETRKSTKCAILNGDLQMLRQETYIAQNTDSTEEPNEG
jgi:hypothetical protein